jgi:membrane associated rhomboid family serine protease
MWDEPKPRWTYIFIAACTLFYLLAQVSNIDAYMAYAPAYTVYQPWTPVTALFMHVDIEHLLYNMIALLIFGSMLEKRIGNQQFFALYLLSGVIGNLGYYLTAVNPRIPVVGASGAIYGIVGTLAVLEPLRLVYIYGLMPLPMIAAAVLWTLGDIVGLRTIHHSPWSPPRWNAGRGDSWIPAQIQTKASRILLESRGWFSV